MCCIPIGRNKYYWQWSYTYWNSSQGNSTYQLEIIKYQPKNDSAQITFLKQRTDSEHLNLDIEKWKERKTYEEEKLNTIVDFILSTDKCRSSILLNYFGESDIKNCDKCDYCIKQKRQDLKEKEFSRISKSLQNILNKKELSLKKNLHPFTRIKWGCNNKCITIPFW